MLQGLLDLAKDYPIIDVRARGLMVAAEFGGKDGGMTPKYGVASEVTKAAMRHDMLLLTAGEQDGLREALFECQQEMAEKAVFRGTSASCCPWGAPEVCLRAAGARETVRFLPPLNISESEVTEALDKLSKALKEVNFG